jgi:hypothetical protein
MSELIVLDTESPENLERKVSIENNIEEDGKDYERKFKL